MRKSRYEFHHQWKADRGQPYAAAHRFDDAKQARAAHDGALTFHWANDADDASVTDLYVVTTDVDETTNRSKLVSSVPIKDGAHRELDDPTLT